MAEPLTPSFARRVPPDDDRERLVCARCGFIAYENPKIVVGSVVRHGDCVLLCRRAIEPRRGFWTLPAGYLELGETPEEGARREAREEANAEIAVSGVLAIYTVRRLSQVQIMHRARLVDPRFSAGPESLEVGLFSFEDLPADLAFPTVRWALAHDREAEARGGAPPFFNPAGEDDPPAL